MAERFRKPALLCCAAVAAIIFAAAPGSTQTRPIVVELFTSQGCSSCPPADKLLGELAQRPNLIALGYHINYWDHLGWKDPLSSEASTERQKAYARRLSGRIYTPEMVIEGEDEFVGSHRDEVLAALSGVHPSATAPVAFTADRRSVAIGAGSGAGEVFLARFIRHRATQIGAGENAGRELDDTNGVETLASLGTWTGAAVRFPIEPPAPGEGVAVLVQTADGKILGAAAVKSEN